MSGNIRNFCIIAHIDHGKSTLADRMLEITGTIKKSDRSQVLDRMDIEQERWITIKLTPARMQWKWVELNLIDTPWHVDFQYEVSRSLAAVEGVVLLVDASQWVQAQTLSTLYMAIDQWLEIIPVLNKIDLPAANPERVAQELENLIGIDKNDIIKISWKTWLNVDQVLDAILEKIPSPDIFKNNNPKKFGFGATISEEEYDGKKILSRSLIFDSVYDKYRWVVVYIKVVEWQLRAWDKIRFAHGENIIELTEVWHFNPDYQKDNSISEGQIWYIITWQKSVRDAKIWDTILRIESAQTKIDNNELKKYIIPGFKKVKPFVYAWVYPIDADDFEKLRDWFEKLTLNDSAVEYEYENSLALGHGFRCWFLWTLHMDIIKERIYREYDVETIFTIPNVVYLVKLKNLTLEEVKTWANVVEVIKSWMYKFIPWFANKEIDVVDLELYRKELEHRLLVRSWATMPDPGYIDEIWEPFADVEIVWPDEYAWNIMDLVKEYRWQMNGMEYIDETRVLWKYIMPLGEIIIDFYDRLKSSTKGYATMNYEFKTYIMSDLVRLDIFINQDRVEAFSMIVHKDKAYYVWRDIVEKLKELIPKHLFPIPLQAGIGNKIIARETISALKKDVLAKCYGWDVSRKRKLLEKQKEWKKKLKQMWKVSVPNDIFIKMVTR